MGWMAGVLDDPPGFPLICALTNLTHTHTLSHTHTHTLTHTHSLTHSAAVLLWSVFFPDRRAPASHLLLEQLPSYQSLLYRRKSSSSGSARRRGSGRGRQPSINSGKWAQQKPVHGGEVLKPVRELPKSMQDKRREK